MKIIPLNESDEMLVRKALRNDANAEEKLFKRFSPKMLAVCRRYIQDLHYAEDVMITGFTKVFENLSRFRFEGNFEGWIRRIMVRESIDFLRSRKQMQFSDIDDAQFFEIEAPESEYDVRTLQLLIDALPDGYKTVLVMFAIDDYSHKEIATTLGISESTSKSQLFKARRMLQAQLEILNRKNHGN